MLIITFFCDWFLYAFDFLVRIRFGGLRDDMNNQLSKRLMFNF